MGLLPSAGNLAEGEVIHLSSGTAWARVGQQSLAPLGRGLSAVFQDPMSSLNPSMHVGWQIAEPLLVHTGASKNEAQKTAIQLIKEVELPDPETTFAKYPHELSGGQKQRVMIALALAAQPELLIADEPTTALDATVQKSILALLLKLQRQRQLSVLFITHDLDVVQEIADRVIVMCQGRIVETGTAKAVLGAPSHPYTQALIDARKPSLYSNRKATGKSFGFLSRSDQTLYHPNQCLGQIPSDLHRSERGQLNFVPRRARGPHRRKRKRKVHAGQTAHRHAGSLRRGRSNLTANPWMPTTGKTMAHGCGSEHSSSSKIRTAH